MVSISVLMLLITWASGLYIKPFETLSNTLFLIIMLSLAAIGAVIFVREEYATKPEGIKNNGVWFKSLASRGIFGWMLGILLTGFYVILYWYPQFMSGLVQLFDPLSILVSGKPADQWFVYGSLYTFGVLVMGYKFALKYRHNRYQLLRTASVCFFQLGFSFLIPSFLKMMNEPDYYFTYFWPLKETVLNQAAIIGAFKALFSRRRTVGVGILSAFQPL